VAVDLLNQSTNVENRLITSTAWAFIIKVLGVTGMLVVNALLARLLSAEDMGAYFLVSSIAMFSAIVARFGLRQTIVRIVAEALELKMFGRMRRVIQISYALITLGVLIVGGSIYFGLGGWLAHDLFKVPVITTAMGVIVLWIVVLAYETPVTEVFRGLHNIRFATLFDGVLTSLILAVLLAIYFVSGSQLDFFHAILISVFAAVLALLFGSYLLFMAAKNFSGEGGLSVREVVGISAPIFLTNITNYLLANAGLWIVGACLSTTDVAIYGAVWKLVNTVLLPLLIVNMAVQPVISELNVRGDKRQLEHALRGTAMLAGLPAFAVLIVMIVFGAELLELIYGEYYRTGASILVILGLGQLVNVWTGSCGVVLAMTGHQRLLMKITMLFGIVTIIAALIAAQYFGLKGVASAMAIGIVVTNVCLLVVVYQQIGIRADATFNPLFIRAAFARFRSH